MGDEGHTRPVTHVLAPRRWRARVRKWRCGHGQQNSGPSGTRHWKLRGTGKNPAKRLRRASRRRTNCTGGHEVEEDGAEAVWHGPGRGLVHGHARRAQVLLPGPRSKRVRGSEGLGTRDFLGKETWSFCRISSERVGKSWQMLICTTRNCSQN